MGKPRPARFAPKSWRFPGREEHFKRQRSGVRMSFGYDDWRTVCGRILPACFQSCNPARGKPANTEYHHILSHHRGKTDNGFIVFTGQSLCAA